MAVTQMFDACSSRFATIQHVEARCTLGSNDVGFGTVPPPVSLSASQWILLWSLLPTPCIGMKVLLEHGKRFF